MKYKTKHRYELLEFLKKNKDRHLSIIEIKDEMGGSIPTATLYRLLDSYVEEGVVRKYIIGPSSSCCFQYIDENHEHNHFHLICEKCGRLIHLECHEVDHLIEHISGEHNFDIDIAKINLYGVCEDCKRESK